MKHVLAVLAFVVLAGCNLFANGEVKMLADLASGNRLTAIAHNSLGTLVCVGRGGTMIRSTDGGRTWGQIAVSSLIEFTDVKFHSGTWHAVGGIWNATTKSRELSLLRSTDDGVSWKQSHDIEGIEKLTLFNFYGLSIVAGALPDVFLIARAGAVLRSTNRGESWHVKSVIGNDTTDRTFLAAALNNGTLVAVLKDSQYVSMDQGNTWTSSGNDLTGDPVELAAFSDTLVLITRKRDMANSRFIVRVNLSTDQGATWKQGPAQSPKAISDFLAVSSTHVVSVGETTEGMVVDVTSDGGETWNSSLSPVFVSVSDLVHVNDTTVLVCSDRKGIFRFNQSVPSVTPVSLFRRNTSYPGLCSFFRVQQSGDLTFSPLNVLQINRSIDDGATWRLDSPLGPEISSILDAIELRGGSQIVLKDNFPYIVTRTSPGSPWVELQDWAIRPRLVSRSSQLSFCNDSVGLFVVGLDNGRNGVCLTVDRGASWRARHSDSVDCGPTRMISDTLGSLIVSASYARNDSNKRTGSMNIATSTDAGTTWKQQPFIPGLAIRDLVLVDRNIVIAASISATTITDGIGFLHRSTDGGVTWTDVLNGGRHWIGTVASRGDTVIAASLNTDSLFISLDAGASWEIRNVSGITLRRISFANSQIRNNTVYLCGSYGDPFLTTNAEGPIILSMPIADLVSHVAESEIVYPNSKVYGNVLIASPNPSHGASRVSCRLPSECSSLVTVTVFTSGGASSIPTSSQIVQVEKDSMVTIETENLVPGVYYALISAPHARFFTSFVVER
jgi:photosystem II stability/assembly factor-like uncharacterized protein